MREEEKGPMNSVHTPRHKLVYDVFKESYSVAFTVKNEESHLRSLLREFPAPSKFNS